MYMTIVPLLPVHWPAVKKIYEEGLSTGNASFETTAPSWENWDAAHLSAPRLVMMQGDTVCGWAALTPVSGRCVYAGVAEVSVYVSHDFRGQGIGRKLLDELIRQSETAQFWTLQAGIFPENQASVALHKSCGFRIVGRREKIGRMNGIWRDTLLLERRSQSIGHS
jgi:phosphinothricin acetyltransferase